MIYDPWPFKRCTKCNIVLLITTRNFRLNKESGELRADCRKCERSRCQKWAELHPGKAAKRASDWRQNNTNRKREYQHNYQIENRVRLREQHRQRDKNNPEKVKARSIISSRRWRKAHPDKRKESVQRYIVNHRDEILQRQRDHRKENPDIGRNQNEKRNTRAKLLPANFTTTEWANCLEYFYGVCAYCGKPPRLWDNPCTMQQDHFIPQSPDYELNKFNPGYVAENIVPACKSCNSSKNNRQPDEWLASKFGKRKAKQILKRIQDYFEWVKGK